MTANRTRAFSAVGLAAVVAAGLALTATTARVLAQAPPSLPERRAEMQHHFIQITQVHDAVIRGDLAAARAPGRELAALDLPAGLPLTAQPFLWPIRTAGRRAANATTIAEAARATATLLAECGECHRTANVRPAIPRRSYADVGGLVGHMLEHYQAVTLLEQGLFTPSGADWQLGAERLKTAPLRAFDLPPDPKLTRQHRQAEERVHALATRAQQAATPPERVAVYADILASCAGCHQLHGKVWGPRN